MDVDTPLSPDWVASNNSNTSVAKDRGWFVTYTPFTSHLTDIYSGTSNVAVCGIGTVEIPVKLKSRRNGKKHTIIRIDDVLHAPNATCNILGQGDFINRHSIQFGGIEGAKGLVKDRGGRIVGYFDKDKTLFCLKLSGPPIGPVTSPSLFGPDRDPHQAYIINAHWPASECARWQTFKPYTDDEKAWLKKHYGGEFRFLQQHGLSIHKDEDREEGKSLARGLIADGSSEEDEKLEQEEDDDANSFLEELEADPMSHVADYKFSDEQLDWIKEHWKHSGNFLLSHGLKPFDDEDCDEGRTILQALMSGGD